MKFLKKLLCIGLAASMLLSGTSALAVNVTDHADYRIGGRIYLEGTLTYPLNDKGQEAYCLVYNNTIYIRLNTAAEWLNKEAVWDKSGSTVSLNGYIPPVFSGEIPPFFESESYDFDLLEKGAEITIRRDLSVAVNGQPITLKDAVGNIIYPIELNNVIYLPIRTISELLGMTITCSSRSSDIYLRTPITDAQLAECKAYAEKIDDLWEITYLYNHTASPYEGKRTLTEDDKIKVETIDDLKKAAAVCRQIMDVIKNAPKPDCKVTDYSYNVMMERLGFAESSYNTLMQMIDSGESFEMCYLQFSVEGRELDGRRKSLIDWIQYTIVAAAMMNDILCEV